MSDGGSVDAIVCRHGEYLHTLPMHDHNTGSYYLCNNNNKAIDSEFARGPQLLLVTGY
jgi:hypothetical protein